MDGGGGGDVISVVRGDRKACIDDCVKFGVEVVIVVCW